jgi:hypothetical protein
MWGFGVQGSGGLDVQLAFSLIFIFGLHECCACLIDLTVDTVLGTESYEFKLY